ncbi:hypothetical protein COLO4_22971 [Corchorus olitorius]|uniref:Uncharacterized protein n=1 Tax=Corchorus olitorius TaxID=93759 RepID=A0A1R3IIT4_9ROSI|nr:hypothetical protein COLO4_22971 [Corchorus olitorius]
MAIAKGEYKWRVTKFSVLIMTEERIRKPKTFDAGNCSSPGPRLMVRPGGLFFMGLIKPGLQMSQKTLACWSNTSGL